MTEPGRARNKHASTRLGKALRTLVRQIVEAVSGRVSRHAVRPPTHAEQRVRRRRNEARRDPTPVEVIAVGNDERYLIGQVAELVGLDAKTIRYYEDVGIIPKPERRAGGFVRGPGYRSYSGADLERLRFVKMARHLDLPLGDIKKLLQAVEDGCCGRAGPQLLQFISAKTAEVDQQMRDLRILHGRLLELKAGIEDMQRARQREETCPSSENPTVCAIGKQSNRNNEERR